MPTVTDIGPHECVNWETFMEWVREKSVNLTGEGVLVDFDG